MNIVSILKEEQKEYRMSLLEDIQDSSGAAVLSVPGLTPAQASVAKPTSASRESRSIKTKILKMKTMEEFLMKLQLIQNMQAQQEQQAQEQENQQVQQNEQFMNSVLNFITEKKNFNIFGPKSLKTLAKLSLAGSIGLASHTAQGEPKKQDQQQVSVAPTEDFDVVRDMLVPQLKQSEGWKPRLYKDHKGNPTIGHGALVDGSFKSTMKKVFPYQSDEWVKKVASGNMELTVSQGHDLLTHQAREKHGETRNMIGHEMFDSMHPELQTALTDAHFRGSLKGSPKTLRLIKMGDLQGASKEFLDNDEYRESVKQGTGVHKRMENVAKTLAKHHGTVKIQQPKEPKKQKTKK
jgi:GH24 family phage-related lysozyme (muramidase)